MSGPPFERLAPAPGAGPSFSESHLAVVTDVDDPDNLGRVKIKLLSYDGPEGQDGPIWARVAVAVAGASRGAFMLPDVNDEVLVSFVGGDPRRPIVIGSLWNGKDRPTEELGSRGVDRWTFTSKDGTRVAITEESSGSAKVTIDVPGGVSAELNQSGGGKLEVKAAGSTVTIDTSGVKVDTPAQVQINASTVTVTASLVSVDAPTVNFSGIVNCPTIVATTVVGTTYTPGAGNVW